MTNSAGDLQNRTPSPPQAAAATSLATHDARERLAIALLAASRSRQTGDPERSATELRAAVAGYMTALRGDGATVEQALIATKELVTSAIGGPNSPPERRALAEQVVSWGIDAYYDSAERAD